ncbi:hypothetical protein [Streptomyces sp. NPDC046976]|uniref:hypothetical protein n=1 Tax=Streptomyces sp. NPDC046976 TaxID=3155258 RepID=UPI0033F436A1
MASPVVRVYKIINASVPTAPFRTAAPTGSVITVVVNGHRERVVLLSYQVNDGRRLAYAAELLKQYL